MGVDSHEYTQWYPFGKVLKIGFSSVLCNRWGWCFCDTKSMLVSQKLVPKEPQNWSSLGRSTENHKNLHIFFTILWRIIGISPFFCGLFFTSPVNAVGSIKCGRVFWCFFPVIFYGWMVSEEKAAKEAGMDPENYQVGVEQVATGGRTAWCLNSEKTLQKRYVSRWPLGFCWENYGWKILTWW